MGAWPLAGHHSQPCGGGYMANLEASDSIICFLKSLVGEIPRNQD